MLLQNVPSPKAVERLATGDWINVVNAFFTMISAIAAATAVGQSLTASREQRTNREADRQQYLYRRLVLDIALTALPAFAEEASAMLNNGQKEILTLDSSLMTHSAVIDKSRHLATQFNSAFFKLRPTMRNALIAWNDPALAEAVNKDLLELQDAVLKAIEKLSADNPSKDPLGTIAGDCTARVLRTIVTYTPTCLTDPEPN